MLEAAINSPPVFARLLPVLALIDSYFQDRGDLIAFDSPFISEPAVTEDDFEKAWHADSSADVRGWFGASLNDTVARLHELEDPGLKLVAIERADPQGMYL